MTICIASRLLLTAVAGLVALAPAVHADSPDASGIPPLRQCYTVSTNPPAGSYDPEVTGALTPNLGHAG